jgi:hypothetical protein
LVLTGFRKSRRYLWAFTGGWPLWRTAAAGLLGDWARPSNPLVPPRLPARMASARGHLIREGSCVSGGGLTSGCPTAALFRSDAARLAGELKAMSDRQFREADAAIERAVATFISTIERMEGRWESVAPTYVIETVLLKLCAKLTELIDAPDLATSLIGSAEVKLSNALADYRDSRARDRGSPLAFRDE